METGPNKKSRKNQPTRKTKTITFKRQFNPNYIPEKGEVNTLPSLTRPDMSLTIHELMRNHTRGIQSDVHNNEPQYFDTEIKRFADITDEIAYKQELAEDIKEQEEIARSESSEKQKLRKEAQKKQKDKDIAEYLRNQKEQPTPPETP